MKKYNENQILFIIRWAPISFIVIISIIITYLRLNDNNILHNNEILELKKNFIQIVENEMKTIQNLIFKWVRLVKSSL